MKVTICSYDGKGYFGGPYEWVKRFCLSLRTHGVDVNILFLSDHKAEVSSTYLYLTEKGFHCKLLSVHSISQYHDNTEDRIRWFLKQVQNNPPDIFIANAVLPALYAGKWIKKTGIPVIGVAHTDDPRYDWLSALFIKGSADFVLSGIVCVSDFLRMKLVESNPYGISIKAISCGTPMPIDRIVEFDDLFKIVYAGKITEEAKQISLLTRAFCETTKKVEGVEAYIYGTGVSQNRVEDIIIQEGCQGSVFYKGFVKSDQIQEEFKDKQVIVLLSDYEGLPVVLLEAMACGLVPVCLKIRSGIPELVKHEETGLLVNDRGDDFVNAIKRLKDDSQLWRKLSNNAQYFIHENHSMDRITKEWLSLFHSLMKNNIVKQNIIIPSVIVLPDVHSLLLTTDVRKKSLANYIKTQWLRLKKNIFY